MSMLSTSPATITLVQAEDSKMTASMYKDRLDVVLSLLNTGGLGRGQVVPYWGSEAHLQALAEVQRRCTEIVVAIEQDALNQTMINAVTENLEHFSPPDLQRLVEEVTVHLGPEEDDAP